MTDTVFAIGDAPVVWHTGTALHVSGWLVFIGVMLLLTLAEEIGRKRG